MTTLEKLILAKIGAIPVGIGGRLSGERLDRVLEPELMAKIAQVAAAECAEDRLKQAIDQLDEALADGVSPNAKED